ERLERVGTRSVERELQAIDAIATPKDFARQAGRLAAMNVNGFVNRSIDSDEHDPNVESLYLGQSGLGLPDRDYYLQSDAKFVEARHAYQAFVERLLPLSHRPDWASRAEKVVALETRLAELQWTRVENRDPLKTYNRLTLEALSRDAPQFDWRAWAQAQGLPAA